MNEAGGPERGPLLPDPGASEGRWKPPMASAPPPTALLGASPRGDLAFPPHQLPTPSRPSLMARPGWVPSGLGSHRAAPLGLSLLCCQTTEGETLSCGLVPRPQPAHLLSCLVRPKHGPHTPKGPGEVRGGQGCTCTLELSQDGAGPSFQGPQEGAPDSVRVTVSVSMRPSLPSEPLAGLTMAGGWLGAGLGVAGGSTGAPSDRVSVGEQMSTQAQGASTGMDR